MTRDFDDPGLYQPAGMKPQCTFIVHWHSCRLDAGHSGKHSPGHERSAGAAPLDVCPDCGLSVVLAAEPNAGAAPLDVERLDTRVLRVEWARHRRFDMAWTGEVCFITCICGAVISSGRWEQHDASECAEYARLAEGTDR